MAIRILIVDDDPDIRDILKITLTEENYEVAEACDGEEALKAVTAKSPNLVLLDYKIPKLDGREVCRRIKNDILLRHLPVIMVTGKGDLNDRVTGLDAGADDYIVKPFEPKELLARIRMALRRTERDLEANPLTRLPGNVSILSELTKKIESREKFAVCYIDINKFKAYNDKYGFEHGDEVIRETARILIRAAQQCGRGGDFIGHIGGDDFVVITSLEAADSICDKIIADFDKAVPSFYNDADRKNGYIIGFDRQGEKQKFPFVSISIGVVTNEFRKIEHVAQVGEIGAELKSFAKNTGKSGYVRDQRKE